jgi:hypothetical protein
MRVSKEFIKNLQGKQFVLFAGLLELAHQDGLNYQDTNILQYPGETNGHTCIVKATVRTSKGEFSAIGDCSPTTAPNAKIAPHAIRMAETRAIARALRVATNVSLTAFEELGETSETIEPAPGANNKTVDLPMTDIKQAKTKLWKAAQAQGMNQAELSIFCESQLSVKPEALTIEQAQTLIDKLAA